MVKAGCGGCLPTGMKHYFSQFSPVEAQQTFYKLPQNGERYVLFTNVTGYGDALSYAKLPQGRLTGGNDR